MSLILRAFALFLVGFVGTIFACASLEEAQGPASEAVKVVALTECYAYALLPVTGTIQNAREAVQAITEGTITLQELFDAAKATETQVRDFQDAITACNAEHAPDLPPVSAPAPEPGRELGGVDDAGVGGAL